MIEFCLKCGAPHDRALAECPEQGEFVGPPLGTCKEPATLGAKYDAEARITIVTPHVATLPDGTTIAIPAGTVLREGTPEQEAARLKSLFTAKVREWQERGWIKKGADPEHLGGLLASPVAPMAPEDAAVFEEAARKAADGKLELTDLLLDFSVAVSRWLRSCDPGQRTDALVLHERIARALPESDPRRQAVDTLRRMLDEPPPAFLAGLPVTSAPEAPPLASPDACPAISRPGMGIIQRCVKGPHGDLEPHQFEDVDEDD